MGLQVFHLEDIVEETGYVLEQDSEYSQKILEEEEEVSLAVTLRGGKSQQHQVGDHMNILLHLLSSPPSSPPSSSSFQSFLPCLS